MEADVQAPHKGKWRLYKHTWANEDQVETIRVGQTIRPEENMGGKDMFPDTRGRISNKTGSQKTDKTKAKHDQLYITFWHWWGGHEAVGGSLERTPQTSSLRWIWTWHILAMRQTFSHYKKKDWKTFAHRLLQFYLPVIKTVLEHWCLAITLQGGYGGTSATEFLVLN